MGMFLLLALFVVVAVILIVRSNSSRANKHDWIEPATTPRIPLSSSARRTEPKDTAMKIRWVGAGERIELHGFTLDSPLTYYAEADPSESESSCIVKWLDVSSPLLEPRGAPGYWPSYQGLLPHQRANYLQWLSGGRRALIEDVGYVFMFYYGLERRALVDNLDHEIILDEVLRLLPDYRSSNSFRNYSTSFLIYILATQKYPFVWIERIVSHPTFPYLALDEEFCNVELAGYASQGRPLPLPIAMAATDIDVRSVRSIVTQRVRAQFEALFAQRYREKYGDGLVLKPTDRMRMISYRPASGSLLHRASGIKPVSLPTYIGASAQLLGLMDIWNACVEELKPLSRVLGTGVGLQSREAYEELPVELRASIDHPDTPAWQSLVARHARPDGSALIEVGEAAPLVGIVETERLTPKQSEKLSSVVGDVGFALEPDARVDGSSYLWKDLIAIFKPRTANAIVTQNYRAAAMMLELASWIAFADGQIDDAELQMMAQSISTLVELDENDTHRLKRLKEVLVARPREPRRLAARIRETLPGEQRQKVAKFLVAVATVNGVVEAQERVALRRVFASLGIEPSLLKEWLPRRKADELVVVRTGEPAAPGEKLAPQMVTPPFVFDREKARELERITEEVTRMLSRALGEEEDDLMHGEGPAAVAKATTIEGERDTQWKDLAPQTHSILRELIQKQEWSRQEFEALARKHGLMPPAVIDRINTWSDEKLGDLLIDEQENIFVNTSLLKSRS